MAKAATATPEKPLAREYETYKSKLPELAGNEGKFALVQNSEVAGVFATYEEALMAGYKKFGLKQPFLVKQISSVETPIFLG